MGKTKEQLRDEINVFVLDHIARHGHGADADRAVGLREEWLVVIAPAVAPVEAPPAAHVEDLKEAENKAKSQEPSILVPPVKPNPEKKP